MLDQKDLQAQIEESPVEGDTKNINYDVHAGYAAQRPYAHLEDRMGRTRGYRTFEEMQAAGAEGMQKNDRGDWVRLVEKIADTRTLKDGRRQVFNAKVPRFVALSLEEARAIGGDFWNGWSWVRNGLKVEKEYPENLGAAGGGQQGEWQDVEVSGDEAQAAQKPAATPAPQGLDRGEAAPQAARVQSQPAPQADKGKEGTRG